MKIIATILAVYVLALLTFPCVDVPFNNNLQKIELSGQTSQNHPGDEDNCTPLCPCDCCVTPVIQVESSIQFKCLDYTQREYSEYTTYYNSNLFGFFWQPPKIS